jgi:hypothetical protein
MFLIFGGKRREVIFLYLSFLVEAKCDFWRRILVRKTISFQDNERIDGALRALCFSSFSIASLIALKTDGLLDTKVTLGRKQWLSEE